MCLIPERITHKKNLVGKGKVLEGIILFAGITT